MGTEFIQSNKNSDYQDLYRVHTLFGNILSFYAVTSKREIFHNVDMDERDMNRFIDLNEERIVYGNNDTIIRLKYLVND